MTSRYGAGPVHLLAHLAAFALIAWAVGQLAGTGGALTIALWFASAALVHDLLLLPLYAGADRVLQRSGPVLTNHVRVPLALSAVTLLGFAPLILGRSDPVLTRVSTLEPTGYLGRWMLLTLALFAGSALVYAVRRARRR